MTDHLDNDKDLETVFKEEIKYRVEQEYQKYHNEVGFKYSGKDFWIEQIVKKLSSTLTQYTQSKLKAFAGEVEKVIPNYVNEDSLKSDAENWAIAGENKANAEIRVSLKAIKEKAGIE